MGYYINFKGCDFRVPKENFLPALKAIKAATRKKMGRSKPKNMAGLNHWSWIDMQTVLDAETLADFLKEARWDPQFDKEGNIVGVEFTGEKLGSEEEWMRVLAPFVQTGSWIEVSGEEDSYWRWVFRNGNLSEENAHIEWDDWEGMLDEVLDRLGTDVLPTLLGHREDLDRLVSQRLSGDEQ